MEAARTRFRTGLGHKRRQSADLAESIRFNGRVKGGFAQYRTNLIEASAFPFLCAKPDREVEHHLASV
jgi:hypothetical protein